MDSTVYFLTVLVGVPALGWYGPTIVRAIRKNFSIKKIKSLIINDKKEGELFKGCPKPSTLLAQLIAGKILREEFGEKVSQTTERGYGSFATREWRHEDIRIRFNGSFQDIYAAGVYHREVSLSFDGDEATVINNALRTAEGLHRDFLANEKTAKAQQDALTAIESIMGVETFPPKPAVLTGA